MQLAYVYSVSIGFACCYTGNLAACYIQATADGCSVFTKHDGFCTIISTDIAHANTAVSNCKVFITIGNDDAIFIQVNFGISIGNRGNISQIACNINLVISLAVFNCRFNCCILTVRQGSMFTCFGCYCMQLATVYCVGRVFGNCTCCYASNLAILVNGNLVVNLNAAICKANAACAFTCAGDGLNASQLFFQRNANFITNIAYLNIIIAIKFNCSARCYNRFSTASSFQLPTLVGISSSFTYLLQLCNVYSISIFSTCCYISNLASLSGTAYRYSTFSSFPNVTCSIIFRNNIFRTGCRIIAYHFGSSVSYAAYAQSNAAFCTYASTAADSNCIIGCNFILMTEGNNIAYASDYVFVAHYNRIGNISQFIVRTCHEYVMATLFIITGKFVIIADNGRIGLFGNSVGTADYCNSTAFFLSQCAIVTLANIVCFKSTYIHILIGISNLVAGTLNRYTIRSLDSVCGAHNIISYAGINLTVFIIYSILRADNGCRCTLNI